MLCFILWIALPYPKYTGASKLIKLKSIDHLEEMLGKPAAEIIRNAKAKKTETKKQKKNFS